MRYDDLDDYVENSLDYYNEELDDLYDDYEDEYEDSIESYDNWDYYYHNIADEIED